MNKKTLISKLACTVLFLSPLALSCCATFVDTPRVDGPDPYARSGAYPRAVVKGQYATTKATTVTKTTKTVKSTHHKAVVPVNAPTVKQTEAVTTTTTPDSAKVIKSTTTTTNTNAVAPTVAPATGMVVPTVGQ